MGAFEILASFAIGYIVLLKIGHFSAYTDLKDRYREKYNQEVGKRVRFERTDGYNPPMYDHTTATVRM
jgi:hypothetical protein